VTDIEVIKQRTIRGEADQVRNAVVTARDQGRLVRVTEARRLTTGQVEVVALMREVQRAPFPIWTVTMVGLLVAAAGFLAWLTYQVVTMVARNFETVIFVCALVAAVTLGLGHKATKAAGCCPCHRR